MRASELWCSYMWGALLSKLRGNVEVLVGDPALIVAQLAAQGLKHLHIDGSQPI